ncbi:MAG: DUF2442 domain-containing protein [Gammaproteobacteria bacterium]|nr:DUF2442 domain-containing protein [Gammaproteobacteria bacterium]MBU1967718.1 DUF2442 domain-containing protein [Gammaproteobacteria bacterium]
MAAPWRITQVHALDDCSSIWVCFTDGLEGVVRFPPEFFQGVFSHLSDPSRFKEVAVEKDRGVRSCNATFSFCDASMQDLTPSPCVTPSPL